jgi:hypothetical protein
MKRESKVLSNGDRQGERETAATCATMNEDEGTSHRKARSDRSIYKERTNGAKRKTTDGQEEGEMSGNEKGN